MPKRLLWVGILILIVLIIFAVLALKKVNLPWQIKQGKFTSITSLSAQALDALTKGNLLAAQSIYQRLINEFPDSSQLINWQKKTEEINIKLLFSSQLTAKSIIYEIKPGDNLAKIAAEFKTTVDLIKKSNGIIDDKIFPGRKIKILAVPFAIVIDKSQNTLILKTNEELIKTYIVSTGLNNSTPVGNFKITNKLTQPTWFKAGAVVPPDSPENILGSRWLGFDLSGYGIHGTTEPQSLGRQVTQGCVRMSNPDVEELYTIVPVGTEVTIVD